MKNFVKLIQQAHAEKFSVVANKIVTLRIPVAFLSVAPIDQTVVIVKNLRSQGLNVTNLFAVDFTPPPPDLEFDVVHLNEAAQIYRPRRKPPPFRAGDIRRNFLLVLV